MRNSKTQCDPFPMAPSLPLRGEKTHSCGLIRTFDFAMARPLARVQGAAAQLEVLPSPSTCDDGNSIQLIFASNGDFTPGHLVVGTQVYVVQSLDATQTFGQRGYVRGRDNSGDPGPLLRRCGAASADEAR